MLFVPVRCLTKGAMAYLSMTQIFVQCRLSEILQNPPNTLISVVYNTGAVAPPPDGHECTGTSLTALAPIT